MNLLQQNVALDFAALWNKYNRGFYVMLKMSDSVRLPSIYILQLLKGNHLSG